MTSTTHHETQIVSDPDVPLVRIVREFDAPPEKVFRAHTDPDLLVQWLGPRSLTMTIDHYDCRTGGSYRYVHERDGEEYGFHGSFHEVRPNELIVQTFTFEGMRRPGEVAPRGPRQRPHPADGDVPGRLLRRPRRVRGQRHGDRRGGGLRAPGRGARPLTDPTRSAHWPPSGP
jgi:uncharacterized protein YndB with AHSA1/START domain